MAGFGEPWDWTTDRNQRMESEYPELANTSADDVLGTDNYAVSQGHAPTQFSSTAMGLGAHSVVSQEKEDNSLWGSIKRIGSSILALDTPISERLGYKVPEGSGPADELANFALEEATRPSNIALALGGFLTGGFSTAGAASKVSLDAAARVAARSAAKNVAMGVGGRVAAAGVEKAAEYAPEEIGPLAGLASAGAGLYATRGRSGLTRTAAAFAAGGIGYASPELAGGIAGGVLTHKVIGGFSSWKEAANAIENRAATQAETQAAQLLEQAEASKQRMRDLAAAEQRSETRIHSDRMPDTPMGQEWENNSLGQVAYKTGGDDVKALAIQVAKDVGEEIPADMAARARNAIASGEQYLLTNSAIELNNWAYLRVSKSGTAYGYSAEGRAAQASATRAAKEKLIAAKEKLIADRAVYKSATGASAAPVVKTATTPVKITAANRRAALRKAPEVKPNEGLLAKNDIAAAPPTAQVAAQAEAAAPSGAVPPGAVKPLWQQTVAEAVGVAPQVPDLPFSSLAKRYGKQGPTPEQVVADRAAKNLRAKGLKQYKAYVERNNLHLQSVKDAIAAGEDVPQEVFNDYSFLKAKTSEAVGSAPAAPKLNYQDIPKGAEPAGRIVEPVPAAKEVNPYLATMRTKPGEPGYAAAVKRAESRWKAQQTIRAAANPAVEPPIASVETPAAPAAAQQVDTPVTPAAAGGGEVPPPPPRETATGGAPEFKGTPQSNRTYATWGDNAAHNQLAAELDPIIEERLGQAAETTANVTRENKKLADIADRQAEKVRDAAISEGKTELQADKIYEEEWNNAYSGERTKSKLDLPLTISKRDADRITQSFARARRAAPGDLFIVNRIKEATRALDAITGKTQGAFKGDLETLKYWVNLMSPEDDLAYVKSKLSKKITFDSKNAKLLETQEKLLKAKPAFGADDIANDVPAVNQAGMGAVDEVAVPRQTGEPTARPNDLTGEPTVRPVDESIIDELTGNPVVKPPVAPDGQTVDGAGSTAGEAEVPGATGGGGKGRGKGAGKGGGDEGGGASSTGDDIEGVPEANDYGKSFRKSVQEIKEAKGVNTFWNILTDVLAAPRSLKASFDLSAAGRQAAPYGYSHPGQALKAFKAQLKAYGSEAGYQESVERLANKPWAGIRNEVVANSLVDQPLLNGERTFISKGLNKVPGFRASERAYATYLNELRDSAFEMMWRNSGLSLEELTSVTNVPKVKAWGDLINAATGHGDIGALFNAKVAGNPILWAPNFLYSRVKLPWIALTQWHQNPEVAFEAAKQLGIFVGVNGALLAGVNASGAASVELDPRSSDFGQMRIGNSRIDPWAGYRPIVNLVARLQSGETKSTTTGDISDPTNLKIVQDFLRNKMEPLSGEILNQILGSNSIGEPTAADTNMAIRLVSPLFLESMVRAINVGGPSVTPSENFSDQIASFGRNVTSPGGLKAAALTLPGVVGVGTATYEPLIKKMDRATLDRMSPQERNKFQTGERRGLANLTPAEQQKAIPALAFRQMYETMPSATKELSNYGSFSGFKRDKIREYAEYYMDNGVSKANAVLRAEQHFQNSGYQQIYQAHVNYLKYQWSEAHPGELAEEIEETYTINPRDRTFRPNAMQKAMAEPYLQKR